MSEDEKIEYSEFVRGLTPAKYYLPMDKNTQDLMHSIFGIATEGGELLDIVKKQYAYGKPFDMLNFIEELGDVMWYIQLGLNAYNVLGKLEFGDKWVDMTVNGLMQVNHDKLTARYGQEFSQDKALNRDLGQEQQVLKDAIDNGGKAD
jgi:NTP pyrophosphatase (non-canonical NTP hydrolase)